MILDENQIYEFIDSIRQEHDDFKKNLFYMSIVYHEYTDLKTLYSLTHKDRKLYNEVVKEYNEEVKKLTNS